MPKKTLLAATFAALLTGVSQAQPIQAELDGRQLRFDQPPVMVGGSVLVPLRGIFEALGADVRYEAATQIIRANRQGRQIQLTIGSSEATVDGNNVHLDSPARAINGSTMVPLRFVSEALGAQVRWISSSHTVVLTSPDGGGQTGYQNPPPSQNYPPPQAAMPTISSVIHNARGPLRPGDRLIVNMTGDPNGQASFEILGSDVNIPMRELSPGSYQGEIVVSPDMRVRQGTLVAHLRRDGREVQQEAQRPISLASRPEGPPPNAGPAFETFPVQGAQIDNPRGEISARVGPQFDPNSVRMIVDNQDVTRFVQRRDSNLYVFVPPTPMPPGVHVANVIATDRRGREENRQWDFQITGGRGTLRPPTMDVQLTNLNNGAQVPPVFNVQGQTAPHAIVQVTADGSRALIPGILTLQGRPLTAAGRADGNGHFDIRFDAMNAPRNQPLHLNVIASDRDGHPGPVQSVDVYVR